MSTSAFSENSKKRTSWTSQHASSPICSTSSSAAEIADVNTWKRDHCYSLQSPQKVKKRYNELLERFETQRRQLYNANRREKTAKRTVKQLIDEARDLKLLNDEANQQLKAYSSKLVHICLAFHY